MREKTRNFLVGLTVMVSLVLLCGMIIIFRELPGFMRLGYEVRAIFPDSGGISSGSDIVLRGMRIGRVAEVKYTDDDPRKGVTLVLVIKRMYRIPGDVNPYIRGRGLAGGAVLELRSDGREPGASRGRQMQWLPQDQVATLRPPPDAPSGPPSIIPAELTRDVRAAMKSFSKLAEGLNTFIAPPDGAATTRPANLHVTMAKLDRAMDAVNAILGDKDSQDNIKGAFAGMKAAADATRQTMKEMHALASEARDSVGKITTRATATAAKFDKLASRLIEDADHLGKLLTALSKAADKLSTDEGTAGRLLTDPKLYNDLLDTAGQLKAALTTLRELLPQWKAGGLTIRIK